MARGECQYDMVQTQVDQRFIEQSWKLIERTQIWCFPAETSEEDGNHATRQIHMYLLRKDHSEEAFGGDLDLQVVQEDCCWRGLYCIVSRGLVVDGSVGR